MAIIAEHGAGLEAGHRRSDSDLKGRLSVLMYAVGDPAGLRQPWIALGIYVVVALMWLVPDRRIGNRLVAPASDDD